MSNRRKVLAAVVAGLILVFWVAVAAAPESINSIATGWVKTAKNRWIKRLIDRRRHAPDDSAN